MIEKFKRGGTGSILLKLDAVYKTGSGVLGVDGKEIVIGDTDYAKERHANTSGIVIQLPVDLGKHPLSSDRMGFPKYGASRLPENDVQISAALYARPVANWKFRNDIAPEVQIGDKVYVMWQTVFDKRNLIAQSPDKKSFIFKVAYDLIYCVVREGAIIPIGSHVLIDPVFESYDSILRPTFYPFNGPDGKPAPRPKKDWIQVKTAPSNVDREGVIAHIGTPLRGERCALKAGMKVLYKPKMKTLLEVEGNKYFIMKQSQILCYRP